MEIRVYYEDTDAGGIVYHANYLKYCERARSEIFFKNGMSPMVQDAHFVVRKMDCNFMASAKLSDLISVTTSIEEIKKTSLILFHEIKDSTLPNKILFSATVVLVLAKDGKAKRIDENTKDMLQSLFGRIDI